MMNADVIYDDRSESLALLFLNVTIRIYNVILSYDSFLKTENNNKTQFAFMNHDREDEEQLGYSNEIQNY